jgi:cytochrome c-type biogenesis protein CcmF
MVENFGFGALVVAFVISLYGIAAAVYGAIKNNLSWAESARRATLLTFPLITLSALMLIILLVNGRYDVQFVYNVTSNSMPLYLKITALWGGQSGSLVFWSWLMAAFGSAVMLRTRP